MIVLAINNKNNSYKPNRLCLGDYEGSLLE